ncbi:MAG: carbohydrate kinase family protein [Clostridia bacterium]|nr:carbohydrate kinase family protein [Clostridia bacterium]
MQYDVICAGMALVDSIIRGLDPEPVSASGYLAESGSLSVGGEAVNTAVAAAKLGLKTGILCALGDDPAGEMVRNELTRNGVDTRFIVKSPATPVSTIIVRADGTRKSVTNQAHRYSFHPEGDPGLFTDARVLILGSLFRAPFDDPVGIHAVLTCAKAAGQIVIADTKLPNFRFLTLKDIAESLPLIDTITPNEDEARYFTGKEEPEAMADAFLALGVKRVIVKLGGKGCQLKSAEQTLRLPAIPIDPVDATGAGDNFVAGFASEILRGASEAEALRFANACGAICTSAVGAGTALRGRDQVLQLLKSAEENGC